MIHFNSIRERIKEVIINKISSNPEVCSITFVGSFVNSDNISTISDIDIIVIVNKLDHKTFLAVESSAKTITSSECGLDDYEIKLNMTFGPLKFNNSKVIVLHLMIYDIDGHKEHVISSPFTCFDWEYYKASYGETLANIYPASPLQLNDLVRSRRGIETYLEDFKKGVITFRYYCFKNEIVSQITDTYSMDERHKIEYAYHIIKFLLHNLLKIIHQYNIRLNDKELVEEVCLLDSAFRNEIEIFLELSEWKNNNLVEPPNICDRLEYFIRFLDSWLSKLEVAMPIVAFMRHGKTDLNDGSFLGIGRDPSLLPILKQEITSDSFDFGYSSMMSRAVETLNLLNCKELVNTALLNEIDYGLAERFTLSEFVSKYPNIKSAWELKEDPRFPAGENQKDVADRLQMFINQNLINTKFKHIVVVTHMVILRCLLGKFYNAALHDWYLFKPNHLEIISTRIFRNTIIPELTHQQRIEFRDQLTLWKTK